MDIRFVEIVFVIKEYLCDDVVYKNCMLSKFFYYLDY